MACKLTARSSKRNENDSKSGKVIIVIDSLLFSCCLFVFGVVCVSLSVGVCIGCGKERESLHSLVTGSLAVLQSYRNSWLCTCVVVEVWPSLNILLLSLLMFSVTGIGSVSVSVSLSRLYMTRVRRISFCVLILGFLGVALPFLDCCCTCCDCSCCMAVVVVVVLGSLSNTVGKLLLLSPM